MAEDLVVGVSLVVRPTRTKRPKRQWGRLSEHERDSSFLVATTKTSKLDRVSEGGDRSKQDLPLWKLQKQLRRATMEPGERRLRF